MLQGMKREERTGLSQMSLNRDPDSLLSCSLVLGNGWFNLCSVIYINYGPVCH